jgi:hypothetical protein
MIDITLAKLKYRNPNSRTLRRTNLDPADGTRVFQAGSYKSKTANQGTASKVKTLKPRRRAYGPF